MSVMKKNPLTMPMFLKSLRSFIAEEESGITDYTTFLAMMPREGVEEIRSVFGRILRDEKEHVALLKKLYHHYRRP